VCCMLSVPLDRIGGFEVDISRDRMYQDNVPLLDGSDVSMEKWKLVTIYTALGLAFLGGIIVFSISWDTIDPTEYGFNYNKVNGHIDTTKLYDSGRYCIGPGHYFVKYPKILTTVEFSSRSGADSAPVVTRTKDGVAITISFSYQYKFPKENMANVYRAFTTNYQQPMIRVARNSMLQVAGNFTSMQYWLGRKQITQDMELVLKKNLVESILCSVGDFQMLKVELPQAYEESIIATQVQQQQVIQQQYQKQVAAVLSQIQQVLAVANQNIVTITSQANATAIGVVNAAHIQAFNYTQHVQASAYARLQSTLNLNSTQLMRYMKIRGIRHKEEGSITVGLNSY